MPLLNIYPRGQFLLADHRSRSGEGRQRKTGVGQVWMGMEREKAQALLALGMLAETRPHQRSMGEQEEKV